MSIAAAIAVVLGMQVVSPPLAGAEAICAPDGGICRSIVTKDGRLADRQRGTRTARISHASTVKPDPCRYVLYDPQPPKSDPIWGGHTTGAIYSYICEEGQDLVAVMWRGTPPTGPGAPVVTAAELAQQALATLRLPKPVLHRSPIEGNDDAGAPYTWVNLWTWYWTSPASWREISKTASLGGLSATVRVAPTKLLFDPGDGQGTVSCPGPGRAWTPADGNKPPTAGGCGYRYRHVSDGVRARVSIRWTVAWTGSDGTGGQLPAMTTQTTSPQFRVEQIQVVNR
jgi:hypothetical protein